MGIRYEQDIVAWANEQAALLRAGRFELLDLDHLADEIEDVGKSEQRELANRMIVLLAHLLKWQFQPERRGNSELRTVRIQREEISLALKETPSLKTSLSNPDWWRKAWLGALGIAIRETGLGDEFPEDCPWSTEQILFPHWMPE